MLKKRSYSVSIGHIDMLGIGLELAWNGGYAREYICI